MAKGERSRSKKDRLPDHRGNPVFIHTDAAGREIAVRLVPNVSNGSRGRLLKVHPVEGSEADAFEVEPRSIRLEDYT